MRSSLLIAPLLALLLPGDLRPASAESEITKLAWLEGTWRLERQGERLEESYGPPLGNSITGTFRWLRGDSAWIYEFLLIEERGGKVTYYLRHFGPGSVGHEAETKPIALPLVDLGDGEAVFEDLASRPQRLILRREGKDGLTVATEGGRDGQLARDEFPFRRVARP